MLLQIFIAFENPNLGSKDKHKTTENDHLGVYQVVLVAVTIFWCKW
jgi:hypothetical protein